MKRIKFNLCHIVFVILILSFTPSLNASQTGAPFMRALFLDFPDDKNIADITDEYMFGPSFLVAPVVEQGEDVRSVYLPQGNEWYDFWNNTNNTLSLAAQKDDFPGAPRSKAIKVTLVDENRTITEEPFVSADKTFEYSGKEMTIKF